jgi:branched-chain amino acid transport system substrate-binding protein
MKRALKDSFRTLLGTLGLSGLIIAIAMASAIAQKRYDPGVTDTEIKIGNIMPYSGPASAYGTIGRTEAAYFDQRRRRYQRPQDQVHFL